MKFYDPFPKDFILKTSFHEVMNRIFWPFQTKSLRIFQAIAFHKVHSNENLVLLSFSLSKN